MSHNPLSVCVRGQTIETKKSNLPEMLHGQIMNMTEHNNRQLAIVTLLLLTSSGEKDLQSWSKANIFTSFSLPHVHWANLVMGFPIVRTAGPVTMPPVDHAPWLLGLWDIPLANWLACMTSIWETRVQSPLGASASCPIIHRNTVTLSPCSVWVWKISATHRLKRFLASMG